MSAGRALLRAVWRRRPADHASTPAVYWGRIGQYEAVTRDGIMFLLSPRPGHPSMRVREPGPEAPSRGSRKAS